MGSNSIFTAILAAGIALWGTWSVIKGFRMKARIDATKSWPATGGRITGVHVETRITSRYQGGRTQRSVRYEPVVTYEYQVGGTTYTGVKIQEAAKTYSKSKADEVAAEYPVGAMAPVYYDPQAPDDAVLVQGGGGALGTILGGFVMILLAAVIAYAIFL